MAGLSMGAPNFANHALASGQVFLDRLFQRAHTSFDAKTAYNGVFADSAAFNRKVQLFWIGAGTAETPCMTAPRRCMRRSTRRVSTTCSMNRRARRTNSRRGAATSQNLRPDFFQPAPAPHRRTLAFRPHRPIGGHKTTVLGHPRVIDSPVGKAVEFNGVDDALFVDVHPLAGAETFTWEIVFRPIRVARRSSAFSICRRRTAIPAADTDTRMLSEIA